MYGMRQKHPRDITRHVVKEIVCSQRHRDAIMPGSGKLHVRSAGERAHLATATNSSLEGLHITWVNIAEKKACPLAPGPPIGAVIH